jgi:hypothetical protein
MEMPCHARGHGIASVVVDSPPLLLVPAADGVVGVGVASGAALTCCPSLILPMMTSSVLPRMRV